MLTGWRLYPDRESLAKLGDGVLVIDVLNEKCWLNSAEIPRLSIAGAAQLAAARPGNQSYTVG